MKPVHTPTHASAHAYTATHESEKPNQSEYAQQRLTSDIAHELRTPLMAILATVEAMQDGALPRDDEHLAIVAHEVQRLARLVDAMLDLAQLENNTYAFHYEVANLLDVVRVILDVQTPLFDSQDISLSLEAPDDAACYWARIDVLALERVLINLLSNALRYTNAGGTVVISLKRMQDVLSLSVQDTGIGIEAQDLPFVFKRFWRSDASRERISGGLGMGLSYVRHVIEHHNGSVSVSSLPHVGSTFTITLPAVHAPAQQA